MGYAAWRRYADVGEFGDGPGWEDDPLFLFYHIDKFLLEESDVFKAGFVGPAR